MSLQTHNPEVLTGLLGLKQPVFRWLVSWSLQVPSISQHPPPSLSLQLTCKNGPCKNYYYYVDITWISYRKQDKESEAQKSQVALSGSPEPEVSTREKDGFIAPEHEPQTHVGTNSQPLPTTWAYMALHKGP